MISPERAIQVLERANPVPTVGGIPKPAAGEALARAQEAASGVRRPVRERSTPQVARGLAIAVAVFALVLVVGWALGQFLGTEAPIIEDPGPTIPPPVTTAPVEGSALPADLADAVASLAATYSSGDFEALEVMLQPGTSFQSAGDPWTNDELRARYEIDSALNTTIELVECTLLEGQRVSCAVERTDDLTRAKGLVPARDVRWQLELVDRTLVSWVETAPTVSSYFDLARTPFQRWLASAHPEIESPATDLRGQPWRPDTDFASLAPGLIDEYLEALASEPRIGEGPEPEMATAIADVAASYGTSAMSGLMAPDFTYRWSVDGDVRLELDAADWLIINEIDQALDTEIVLSNCFVVDASNARCNTLRIDDLARVRGLPQVTNRDTPSFREVAWEMTFDEGRLARLVESGPTESQLYVAAVEPFEIWVESERPDLSSPLTAPEGGPWRTDIGLEDVMSELVQQWAQSEGVSLDG